jgi:C4-type Zn-finger protein
MESIVVVLGLMMLLGVWWLFPNLFSARCPICNTRLDSIQELEQISDWQGWRLVWHNFVCPSCGYRWRRIEVVRRPKRMGA